MSSTASVLNKSTPIALGVVLVVVAFVITIFWQFNAVYSKVIDEVAQVRIEVMPAISRIDANLRSLDATMAEVKTVLNGRMTRAEVGLLIEGKIRECERTFEDRLRDIKNRLDVLEKR